MMDRDQLLQQCQSLVPLSTMRQQHLSAALESAEHVTAFRGDLLFDESSDLSSLYYLLSGEIRLCHNSGRERIITADFHWLPVVQFQSEQFSAVALTDCELLKFDRWQLDNLLTWSQVADYLDIDISYNRDFDEDADWMSTILKSNLFYKIPPLNVLSIYSKVAPKMVSSGDIILREGEQGDYCYFIKEGRASVTKTIDGQETPLAEIGEGRCFGEDALIHQTTRNATVKMITDGTLMCLHKADFDDLLQGPNLDHIPLVSASMIDDASYQYLDVRTQEEFDYRHIKDALHIPLTLLRLKIRLLNPDSHYLVYCNTGARSRAAAFLLASKGFRVSLLDSGLSTLSEQQVDELLISEYDDIHQLASVSQK